MNRLVVPLSEFTAETAAELRLKAPGAYVEVPGERKTEAQQRRDLVVELRREDPKHWTHRRIAIMVGLTEGRVRRILREERQAGTSPVGAVSPTTPADRTWVRGPAAVPAGSAQRIVDEDRRD